MLHKKQQTIIINTLKETEASTFFITSITNTMKESNKAIITVTDKLKLELFNNDQRTFTFTNGD